MSLRQAHRLLAGKNIRFSINNEGGCRNVVACRTYHAFMSQGLKTTQCRRACKSCNDKDLRIIVKEVDQTVRYVHYVLRMTTMIHDNMTTLIVTPAILVGAVGNMAWAKGVFTRAKMAQGASYEQGK